MSTTAALMAAALAVTLGPVDTASAQGATRPAKPAVVQDNTWYLREQLSTGTADQRFKYGSPGDTRVMGDWDGDGVRTPGVIRYEGDRDNDGNTDMVWYLRNSNSAGYADTVLSFGEARNAEDIDTPIVGDWDGDGDETVGVVRPQYDGLTSFLWLLKNENTSGNADLSYEFGHPYNYGRMDPRELRGDPVVGDWDGDGTTTVGVVYRQPREGGAARWALNDDHREDAPEHEFRYGSADDHPLVGDWDGDGDVTAGVHRLPNHWFITNQNATGTADQHFRYGTNRMRPRVWR